ncbi:glycosyltransferase family 34 protein [Stemphylium lycopersici]|uniref:Glycosyltransferase family 34 protein n=1 Tax=Stemphylium lycopersici TaxID=183478 RepID=A0A364N2X2_STELY|nr:glycosyltransferase family 34 protein [Stemphylium lycopersici]
MGKTCTDGISGDILVMALAKRRPLKGYRITKPQLFHIACRIQALDLYQEPMRIQGAPKAPLQISEARLRWKTACVFPDFKFIHLNPPGTLKRVCMTDGDEVAPVRKERTTKAVPVGETWRTTSPGLPSPKGLSGYFEPHNEYGLENNVTFIVQNYHQANSRTPLELNPHQNQICGAWVEVFPAIPVNAGRPFLKSAITTFATSIRCHTVKPEFRKSPISQVYFSALKRLGLAIEEAKGVFRVEHCIAIMCLAVTDDLLANLAPTHQLRQDLQDFLQSLQEWELTTQLHTSSPLSWTSSVAGEALPAIAETLWFPDIMTANSLTHYWAFKIIAKTHLDKVNAALYTLEAEPFIIEPASDTEESTADLAEMICNSMSYLTQPGAPLHHAGSAFFTLPTALAVFQKEPTRYSRLFLLSLVAGKPASISHALSFSHSPPTPSILQSAPFQLPGFDTASPDASALSKPRPRIGKVTASFGPEDPTYEAAISSHKTHDAIHNYPHFILRERILHGLWSKHAFLLTILGAELAKPQEERLEWLFWHDRDTMIMNPNIPLEIFLPPSAAAAARTTTAPRKRKDDKKENVDAKTSSKDIKMILTNDRNGLNNGVFFLRVSTWAVEYLAAALSYPEYEPDVKLKYSEQSAMEQVSLRPRFAPAIVHVPQRWFNGFPPSAKDPQKPAAARPGSLLIHFASNRDGKRPERMAKWGRVLGEVGNEWDVPLNGTRYGMEIEEFWERLGRGDDEGEVCEDIGGRAWG